MGSIGWKRFKFFDEERFRDTPFPEGVTAACAGPDDDIWLACADGLMVCMDRELAIRTTFTAFRGKVHFLDFSKVRKHNFSLVLRHGYNSLIEPSQYSRIINSLSPFAGEVGSYW